MTESRAHEKKRILFLCTGNSCRSQMAEGWARHLYGDRIEVRSAGTAPHGVDPRAVTVMSEAGVDISGQGSTHVDEVLNIPFDLVITVCDNALEACPVFPGAGRKIRRSFPDPPSLARNAATENEALEHYRKVRDGIQRFVRELEKSSRIG